MVYDPAGRRMIQFGGYDVSDWRNDLFTLVLDALPYWERVHPNLVGPRWGHDAIYDPLADRMLLYGGNNFRTLLGDTRELPFSADAEWVDLFVTDPKPLPFVYHSLIHDPARNRMILHGGLHNSFATGGTWELPLTGPSNWTPIPYMSGPFPLGRYLHTAIHDPVRSRMIVFGGGAGQDDVWALTLTGDPIWSILDLLGEKLPSRRMHTAVYDSRRDRMIVFGGDNLSGAFNDLWGLSLTEPHAWSLIPAAGELPSARWGHGLVYDEPRDRLILFGGIDFVHWLNDVWVFSFAAATWERATVGDPPEGRMLFAYALDTVRHRLVVHGGRTMNERELDDTWALSLVPPPWTVDIDVEPGDPANRIRIGPGDVTVAVMGSVELNVTEIDLPSLRLATAEAKQNSKVEDVNGDGQTDLVLRFPSRDLLLRWNQTTVELEGLTKRGLPLRGEDEIAVVDRLRPHETSASIMSVSASPNPVKEAAILQLRFPDSGRADLGLFDVRGRCVFHRDLGALGIGEHEIRWDRPRGLGAGVYTWRLRASNQERRTRMVLL